MTRLGLIVLTVLPVSGMQAQETRRLSQDISEVAVHSRKLKLENMLDSVIRYASKSYVEPQVQAVIQRTLLYKPGVDTVFQVRIPAYLVKGNEYTYMLKRDTTETPVVSDRLPKRSHQRVIHFLGFPETTNLLAYLESCAEASVTQKGFYAVSGWGDSLRYHVIVPRKFSRNLLTRMFTTKMDDDTILNYYQYTIRRKGWVLEEAIWKSTTASKELVRRFRKSTSYHEVDSLMTAARVNDRSRQITGYKGWTEGENGRYYFSDYVLRDNLLFIAQDPFSRKDEMQAYTFGYETHFDPTRFRANDSNLRYFMVQQFFNKSQSEPAQSAEVRVIDAH